MAETFAVKIAKEQAKLKRQALSATAAPRLQHASLDDTDLPMYDRAGQLKGTLGKQADGSFGVVPKNSPDQPTLSAPILPVPVDGERVPNNFPVEWDGNVVAGVVPEVHGRTDVWYQMVANESAVDAGGWRLGGSIRDRLGGATTIVVPGTGLVAVAFQMAGADRVTKGPFSAPSFVTVTARVDAQDIADRLDAFADGELPDGAYDNLMARLGEFLHVRADQIDVNSLAADTAFIGLLEAAGITLSDEAGGRRFTVSGQGWRLEDTMSGQVVAQLGVDGEDLLSLFNPETGTPAINMTGAGGIAAAHLSSDADPHFSGQPLLGRHAESPRAQVVDSVIDNASLGAEVHWSRVFNSETSTVGGAQVGLGVAHLECDVQPGRLYKIKCHNFEMGNRVAYWMRAILTTSNDPAVRPDRPTATTPSTSLLGPLVSGAIPPAATGAGTSLGYEWFVSFPQAQRMRVIFTVGNSTDVGNTFGSGVRHQARVWIEDAGPSAGARGYDIFSGANTTTESIAELPEGISQQYGIAQTATYTLNLTTRVATRAYFGGSPRFGRWDTGVHYMTLVDFASWSAQAGTRTSARYNVSVGNYLNASRGNIFQSAVPTFEGLPASFNFDTDLMVLPDQRNVARWSIRGVTPNDLIMPGVLAGSRASVAIGRTGYGLLTGGLPASGVLNLGPGLTTAQLSTELGGGVEA